MIQRSWLWTLIAIYALGRVTQRFADVVPVIWIVVLHVVPPALFALLHGAAVMGRKRILQFAAICLGTGGLAEIIGTRSGFPFGGYHFTSVMGPKILDIPVLLALAYLGIGYCSWVMAMLIAGRRRPWWTPLLAALIMTSWDLAMEPNWATVIQAWIWHEGGPYFGVPVSNFVGWYVTACAYYSLFALVWRDRELAGTPSFIRLAAVLYAVCAFGNLLMTRPPVAPSVVTDATGRQWMTSDIYAASAFVSVFLMGMFVVLAWRATMGGLSPRLGPETLL